MEEIESNQVPYQQEYGKKPQHAPTPSA